MGLACLMSEFWDSSGQIYTICQAVSQETPPLPQESREYLWNANCYLEPPRCTPRVRPFLSSIGGSTTGESGSAPTLCLCSLLSCTMTTWRRSFAVPLCWWVHWLHRIMQLQSGRAWIWTWLSKSWRHPLTLQPRTNLKCLLQSLSKEWLI